jgi:hypothetical protein
VAGGGDQADSVEHGAAPHGDHKGVPVNPVLLDQTLHPFHVEKLGLDLLAARHPDWRSDELDGRCVGRGVR